MSAIIKCKNPFERFPQEIWEMLFDELECNEVESLYNGVPKLALSIENLQRYWFIGKVIQILSTHLGHEDIMNLRLVCKQWKRRVDNFLQNQPYLRAYSDPQDNTNSTFWSFLDAHQCIPIKSHVKTIDMEFITKYQSLIDNLQSRPANSNPFPFRLLKLDITVAVDNSMEHINTMINILERFGKHVWNLELTVPSSMNRTEIESLVKILKLCPKLKNVRLEFTTDINRPVDANPENLEYLNNNLPLLADLKAIKVSKYDEFCSEYARVLFRRYGPQLTRLTTLEWVGQEGWGFYGLSRLLPSLNELRIGVFSSNDDLAKLNELIDFLSELKSPQLKMLQIKYFNNEDSITVSIENCIFPWLRKFDHLKYLEITPLNGLPLQQQILLIEEGTANPLQDSFPSVETLKLSDSTDLQYNFLKCFPSVKLFEIYTFNDIDNTDEVYLAKCSPIKRCIAKLDGYNPVVWNLFPKLKLFVIMAHYGFWNDPCCAHKFHLSEYLKMQER